MAEKLFVRFSTAADEKAIFDFYAENKHQFVFQRDPEVWKERIASGAVTLIHDAQGKIFASSISYPVIVKDEKGDDVHKWTEIGSTRVAVDGIGLFKHLISAQILRAFLLEPPEDRFALEIVLGNEHSKHVFIKNGAAPFNIPKEMEEKICATIAPESGGQKVEWFQIGVEAIPQFAKNIVDALASAKVVHKATGVEYDIDFSKCVLTTIFKEEIETLSGLHFGDTAKPNPHHGVKAFSDKCKP